MGFQENKVIIEKFFSIKYWPDHSEFVYDIIHSDYPNEVHIADVIRRKFGRVDKGPEGWLLRNTNTLPTQEIIHLFGDDKTILVEYLMEVDLSTSVFRDYPKEAENYKVHGYSTFNFVEGKIISLRQMYGAYRIRRKSTTDIKIDEKVLKRYLDAVKESGIVE